MIAEHRKMTLLILTPADTLDVQTLAPFVGSLIANLAVYDKKEELILYPPIYCTLPLSDRKSCSTNALKDSLRFNCNLTLILPRFHGLN
jgi:hypothetical protein